MRIGESRRVCLGVYLRGFEYWKSPWHPSWDNSNRGHLREQYARWGSSQSVCCRSHPPYVRDVEGQDADGVEDAGAGAGVDGHGVGGVAARGAVRGDDGVGVMDDKESLVGSALPEYSKVQVQKL